MNMDSNESEKDLLRGILDEVRDLNAQLARIDERSQKNQDEMQKLRENRISPVEREVDTVSEKARRNSLILGAFLTFTTLTTGAAATYAVTLL